MTPASANILLTVSGLIESLEAERDLCRANAVDLQKQLDAERQTTADLTLRVEALHEERDRLAEQIASFGLVTVRTADEMSNALATASAIRIAGRIRLTRTLWVKRSRISIIGEPGSVIEIAESVEAAFRVASQSRDVTFSRLTFDAVTPRSATGIVIEGAGVTVEQCVCRKLGMLASLLGAANVDLVGNRTEGESSLFLRMFWAQAFNGRRCRNLTVMDNLIHHVSAGHGMRFHEVDGLILNGNTVTLKNTDTDRYQTLRTHDVSDLTIKGNSFSGGRVDIAGPEKEALDKGVVPVVTNIDCTGNTFARGADLQLLPNVSGGMVYANEWRDGTRCKVLGAVGVTVE
jgi:hypothetical protein